MPGTTVLASKLNQQCLAWLTSATSPEAEDNRND
jgi:hypothetical protein